MTSNLNIEKMPIKKQKDIQRHYLKKMLILASQKSKFHKKWFKKHKIDVNKIKNLEDYQKLPLMDKTQILENDFWDFTCADRLSLLMGTGGTSGRSKLISFSKKGLEKGLETYLRTYALCGITKDDVLYPDVILGGMAGNGVIMLLSFTRLGGFYIPAGTGIGYDYTGEMLKRCKATLIWSSPARAVVMTKELKQRGYNLKKDFKIKKIICSGMPLHHNTRRLLTEEWDAEIYNVAGAAEVGGLIGSECREHNGLHLFPDITYWEVLDPNTHQLIKEEKEGEAIVTNLMNEGMPLFRFQLNDLVKITKEKCKCGRLTPRLWILGRTSETIFFGSHKVYGYQIDDVLRKLPELSGIYQLHVTQEGPISVLSYKLETIKLVKNSLLRDLQQKIKNKLENLSVSFQRGIQEGRYAVRIKLVPPDTVSRTERGKIKDKIIDERKLL